jgi:hypothetical protein
VSVPSGWRRKKPVPAQSLTALDFGMQSIDDYYKSILGEAKPMATARKNTKTTVTVTGATLELTEREAYALLFLASSVSGKNGLRESADNVRLALVAAGFKVSDDGYRMLTSAYQGAITPSLDAYASPFSSILRGNF